MRHGASGYKQKCRCDICRAGHREEARRTRTKNPEKVASTLRAWRKKNSEHLKQYTHDRYSTNPEYFLTHNKQWMKEHRDERRKYNKEWRDANPQKVKNNKRKYRTLHAKEISQRAKIRYQRIRQQRISAAIAWAQTPKGKKSKKITGMNRRAAKGRTTAEQLQGRWDYYDGKCWMCYSNATEFDHVIPLNKGGTNWPANLRPACRPCNASKGDKLLHR